MDFTQAVINTGSIVTEAGHVFIGNPTIGPNANLCTYPHDITFLPNPLFRPHAWCHIPPVAPLTYPTCPPAITKIVNNPAPAPDTVFDLPETRNDRFVGREDALQRLSS